MVKPYRKFHSIKALEWKLCHQYEYPIKTMIFTKFKRDMTSSIQDTGFRKSPSYKQQLPPLSGSDVIKFHIHVCPPSHRIYVPSFSTITGTVFEILSFLDFVRK